MSPGSLLPLLFFSALASVLLFCALDGPTRRLAKNHWPTTLAIAALTVAFRLPIISGWFHGLEYEDAYVYTVAARQLLLGVIPGANPANSPFLTTLCAVGSILHCASSGTYSGHYLGAPYVTAELARVVGYFPHVASLLALLSAVVQAVALYWLSKLMFTRPRSSGLTAPILFATTPLFAVYGTTGSAEPLSGTLVVVALFLFVRFVHDPNHNRRTILSLLNWTALLTVVLLACTTKREDVLLVIILPVIALGFYLLKVGDSSGPRRVLALAVLGAVVTAFTLTALEVGDNFAQEQNEFGMFPFSARLALSMLPHIVSALSDPRWYLLTGLLALVGLCFGVRGSRLVAYPSALLLGYLVLYSAHVRSYYQVFHNELSPQDTLRYMINLTGLWALLGAAGLDAVADLANRRLSLLSRLRATGTLRAFGLSAFLVVSFLLTAVLRADAVREETLVRTGPARMTLDHVARHPDKQTVVITFEPLVLQIYGEPSLEVVSIYSLRVFSLEQLMAANPGKSFVFLAQTVYENPNDRLRYRDQLKTIEAVRRNVLERSDGATLYQLERVGPSAHPW